MNDYSPLLFSLHAMSVYRSLLKDPVVAGMAALLGGLAGEPEQAADHYGALTGVLEQSGMSLCDYVYHAALFDDNPFTRLAASDERVPARISAAVRHDLRALSELAYITPGELKEQMKKCYPGFAGRIDALPEYGVGHMRYLTDEQDWGNEMRSFREFCRENGCGEQARFQMLVSDEDTARELLENAGPEVRRLLMRQV